LTLALHWAADSGLRLVRFASADSLAVIVEQAKADFDGAFELEVPNCSLSIPGRISLIRFVRDPNARRVEVPAATDVRRGRRKSARRLGDAESGRRCVSMVVADRVGFRPASRAGSGAMNTASHPVEELPSDLLTAVSRPRANRSAGSPDVNQDLSMPEPEVDQIVVGADDVAIEPGEVSVSPGLKTRLSIEPAAFTFDFVDGSRLTVSDPHCVDLCATRALAVSGSHSVENIP
jgi:hypothetical protein